MSNGQEGSSTPETLAALVSIAQLTSDFEQRFREGDTPWEDPHPWPGLAELFERHVPRGATVLDAGCGLGTNALELASLGYQVTGVDVSPTAIAAAQSRRELAGVACRLLVADVLADDLGVFDVIFDRGCLHGFADRDSRLAFATSVARLLTPSGLWLDISGSADNGDPPEVICEWGLPRLSLSDIAAATEPLFEVVELRRDLFGTTPDTDFLAWVGAFRRRLSGRTRHDQLRCPRDSNWYPNGTQSPPSTLDVRPLKADG